MRQLFHTAIGIFFWIVLVGLWIALATEGRAGMDNITYSVQYVAVIAGAVLGVTVLWVRHNMRIYAKKGPRGHRPPQPPRTDEDRLGRPLRWQFADGHADAVGTSHIVVALDGEAKVYAAAGA